MDPGRSTEMAAATLASLREASTRLKKSSWESLKNAAKKNP
jgi:hypothetical protein